MNKIFGHREEEKIIYSPEIAQRLPGGVKPDRIYGLRQTRNLENCLYDTIKNRSHHSGHMQQVYEILGPQPINQDGDALLFPFLVLEAKSGDAIDNWHSIDMQSAFSIRAFLEIQNRLKTLAPSQRPEQESRPLVWYFRNKGEDWRLSIAFMQPCLSEPNVTGINEIVSSGHSRISLTCL
jgi:hypothetical protein